MLDRRLFLTALPAAARLGATPPARPVRLFDGRTLRGWKPQIYPELKAWVEKGELRLLSNKPVWLIHEAVYGDFVLEADLLVPDGGNSGVQFRSHHEGKRLYGYQAEIDTSSRRWSGGLYDQGRRAWLGPLEGKPEARRAYRNNQWNTVRVECIADRIRIWMNGTPTVDYIDPLDVEGHVALQHHGNFQGHPADTFRFKNLRLRPLGARRWVAAEDAGVRWSSTPAGWLRSDSRVIWRPSRPESAAAHFGSVPREEFTLRFSCKPIENGARLTLPDSTGRVSLALSPDEHFGRLDRPQSSPQAPASKQVKPFFTPALWNAVALSSRAGRFVVHVNGVRTADWTRPRPGALEGFTFESASGSHIEFRDFELLT